MQYLLNLHSYVLVYLDKTAQIAAEYSKNTHSVIIYEI